MTIVASPTPTTFNVDGVDYTLSMSFLDNGNPVSEFITREGGTTNTLGPGRGNLRCRLARRQLMVDEVGPGDDESGGVRAISPSTCRTRGLSTRST